MAAPPTGCTQRWSWRRFSSNVVFPSAFGPKYWGSGPLLSRYHPLHCQNVWTWYLLLQGNEYYKLKRHKWNQLTEIMIKLRVVSVTCEWYVGLQLPQQKIAVNCRHPLVQNTALHQSKRLVKQKWIHKIHQCYQFVTKHPTWNPKSRNVITSSHQNFDQYANFHTETRKLEKR